LDLGDREVRLRKSNENSDEVGAIPVTEDKMSYKVGTGKEHSDCSRHEDISSRDRIQTMQDVFAKSKVTLDLQKLAPIYVE